MFPRHAVIVTAAGMSQRFSEGSGLPSKKEFVKIDGHSVLYRSIKPFMDLPNLCAVFVTFRKGTESLTRAALEDLTSSSIPLLLIEGGKTRQESVFNALKELYAQNNTLNAEIVSIHDGARPFVSSDTIMDCIAYAKLFGASAPGIPVRDTLVRVSEEGMISSYVERDGAYQIQTPQSFKFPDIFNAHVEAIRNGKLNYTDDTGIFRDFGGKVAVTAGSPENIKITYASDLEKQQC